MPIRRFAVPAAVLAVVLAAAPARGQAPLTLRAVIETTLARSPELAMGEQDVRAQEANLIGASGAFDPLARAEMTRNRTRTPLFGGEEDAPSSSLANQLGYNVGVDWRSRMGLVVSPSLSFTGSDVSTTPGAVRNTGVAALELALPLRRGRGGGALRLQESSAALGYQASRADYAQLRSARAADAVRAYWGYAEAAEALGALREAEERARTLLDQTRALIRADERPAVDSISARANAIAKTASRLAGENTLARARQELAVAMGLPAEELRSLPAPADSFPAIPDSAAVARWPGEAEWIRIALERRPDLDAARKRHAASSQQARAARDEGRSRLDLTGGIGYTGIGLGEQVDRFLTPIGSDRAGMRLQLGLAYDFPLGNHSARGQRYRSAAADRRAELAAQEQARKIELSVATSHETLRRTVAEARLSDEAMRLFGAAVDGQREKFQLGTATLLDVLNVEDSRNGARLSAIAARRRYAVALADFRHETGTLLGEEGCAPPPPTTLDHGVGTCAR